MKKLLITSMAAVAIGLYAKADDTGFTETSENFESKNIGPLFEQGEVDTDDEGKYIVDRSEWSTAATPDDGVFTVTNINHITKKAGYTLAEGNTKALAIDTSASLMRNAVTSGDASQTGYVMAGNESIFFDSLVQFTATESIPTPSTGDKLVIGLFADEDPEVNADLGALDNATNLVVISAVLNQNGEIIANATNIIDNTNLNVGPEEWHRLTIQVMNNSEFTDQVNVPGFKVFVDENEVKVNGENKIFHSLVKYVGAGANVLKGVAFEGKGAVDDLVFTTDAPTFVGGGGEEPEPEEKYYKLDIVGDYFTYVVYEDSAWEYEVKDTTKIEVAKKTLWLEIKPVEDYELESIKLGDTFVTPLPDYSEYEGSYALDALEISNGDIENGAVFTLTIQMKKKPSSGGDVTVGDTTVQIGDDGKITNITTAFNGMTVSGNLDTSKFKDYYVVSVDNGVLSIKLNQKAAAPFAKAEELTEGLEEVLDMDATMKDGNNNDVPAVGICIKTFNGLYYGLGTAAELGGSWDGPTDWEDGTGGVIQLKAAKQGDTRFYKIVVTDIEPAQ